MFVIGFLRANIYYNQVIPKFKQHDGFFWSTLRPIEGKIPIRVYVIEKIYAFLMWCGEMMRISWLFDDPTIYWSV